MLQFTMNRDLRANEASVRRLLEAHVVFERMSAAKRFSLHLLVLVGVVIWIGAMWPALLPGNLLETALAVWGGLLFIAVLASVEEWVWHRRVVRYRSEHQAHQNSTLTP
jgi:hypothetical protein